MLLEAHNLSKSYQENQDPILREIHSAQSSVHH